MLNNLLQKLITDQFGRHCMTGSHFKPKQYINIYINITELEQTLIC